MNAFFSSSKKRLKSQYTNCWKTKRKPHSDKWGSAQWKLNKMKMAVSFCSKGKQRTQNKKIKKKKNRNEIGSP
jgi:hypothetical protein